MSPSTYDCIVVGSGHAASSAALSAVEAGSKRVLVVEKGPAEWVGGNGYFTAGAHRTVHGGLQDLLDIVTNVAPELAATIDMDPYTPQQFTDDIMRLSDGRSDPAMVKAVVDGSREAVGWLAEKVGVPFIFSFNRQAYLVNGRHKLDAHWRRPASRRGLIHLPSNSSQTRGLLPGWWSNVVGRESSSKHLP